LQWDVDSIRFVVWEIRIARAASILRRGQQRRRERNVVRWDAHYPVGFARLRVVAVDAIGGYVAVPEQQPAVADAAAAVLNRILLAVILDRGEIGDVARGQLEVAAEQLSETGNLPSADEGVEQAAGVAADQFALTERQVHEEIPVHAML